MILTVDKTTNLADIYKKESEERSHLTLMTGNYLTNTFFLLVILIILLIRSQYAFHQKRSRRSCLFLIAATMFYILMDGIFIACDLNENSSRTLFCTVVFFFYLAYSTLPFAWHMFVRAFVGSSFNSTFRKLEYIPQIFLYVLILITPFTGALYSIAEDGSYIRGSMFTAYSIVNLFYYIEPFLDTIVICVQHEQPKEKYYRQSMMISSIPLIATFINSFAIPIYQIYPFQPFCSVIMILLAFFFMASINSDYIQNAYREELQTTLRQAEEANLAKTKFLSNMSHDIRTPMNAIINLTDLAQKEDDISVIKEYLKKIKISSNFLLGLIGDILDMSRIESGKLQLNEESLNRTEFIQTVDTVIRPLMAERHINFHTELRPGAYTIGVDKLRFNQIFFNLLSNAAKFTPEGGDVWFEVENLEVENNMLKIRFVVRDNGIGMSEEFQKHLFEPFAREHSQLNSSVTGTGLGLSIVKNLVDAMNGTISVNSKLGEGTEFVVLIDVPILSNHNDYLPDNASEQSQKKQDSAAEPVSLTGMHVLLVEDNELNTYVAQIILEKLGCIVTTASNGEEAITAFAASKCDEIHAILMDVRMPVMDGLKASESIRALDRPDAATVPIVAVTADVFEEDRRQIHDAGMNYYLSKPLDAQQVYEVLAKCKQNKEV